MIPARLLAALAGVAVLLAACGGSTETVAVPPPRVPDGVVPATVAGDLTVTEYPGATQAFARAGETSLVADGRVWQIRRGAVLVGTLQVSTVKPEVSLADGDDRKAILDGVMTGLSYETIDVGATQVIASTASDKAIYLWFGPKLFEVLQVKSSKVDPDTVAADLLEHQQATGLLPAR